MLCQAVECTAYMLVISRNCYFNLVSFSGILTQKKIKILCHARTNSYWDKLSWTWKRLQAQNIFLMKTVISNLYQLYCAKFFHIKRSQACDVIISRITGLGSRIAVEDDAIPAQVISLLANDLKF